MFYSYKELKKLANLPEKTSIEQITEAITSIGFEVEGYEKFVNIEGIKFGKVLNISKNPNADKLSVCEIEFNDKKRIIQTTASNVKVNDIVIAFIPGSKANGITFAKKELKGVVSEGMLSSPAEFGINTDLIRENINKGIATYNSIKDLSLDPITYLDLNDYIIEVDILSNRSDAASYYVMAIELAAYFKTKINLPEIKEGKELTKINVKNNKLASIVAFETKNNFDISIKEQIFLAKHKIKSINNAVDLSNLSLLFSGQPTHAYDAKKVGKTIEAKAFTGKLTVLGNKEVELKNNLVVHIDNKPECIASVIGLESSACNENTENILIELGRFDIKEVRKSTKASKLTTEAGSQGGKALSIGTTEMALRYLSSKLKDYSNFVGYKKLADKIMDFDDSKTKDLAGFDITKENKYKEVITALNSLGFIFNKNKVTIPSYRHDVETTQDINEEIFRFYGYENFKAEAPVITPFKVTNVLNIKKAISLMGYQEIRTYALISKEKNIVNPFEFKKDVALSTYVSKEREVIRNSQALSILEVAEYNIKRGIKNLSLFSIGMINDGIKTLAIASNIKNFKEIQQEIVNLIPNAKFKRSSNKNLHEGVSGNIFVNNKQIGWIGKVHPKINSYDLFIAEIKIEDIKESKVNFKDYDDKPLKFKDITYELSSKEELSSKIEEFKDAYSVKVIDEYKDGNTLKITVKIIK